MNINLNKREVQFQTQMEKGASEGQQNIELSSTPKGEVCIQLNLFKAINISFGVFLAITMFGAITKD